MNIALVLAGGTGTRLGTDIPKQYIRVNGRMIIDYCLETMEHSKDIDEVWIVADKMWQQHIKKINKFKGYACPGSNRQLSIYNGLRAIETSGSAYEGYGIL